MPDAQLSLSADYQSQLLPTYAEPRRADGPAAPATGAVPAAAVLVPTAVTSAAVAQPQPADADCAAQISAFNTWLEQWQAGIRNVLTPRATAPSEVQSNAVIVECASEKAVARPCTIERPSPARSPLQPLALPGALSQAQLPPQPQRSPQPCVLQQLNSTQPAFSTDRRKQALAFRQFALSRKEST